MSDPHHPNPHDPVHPAHHVHEAPPLHDPVDEWHDHSHDERPQHAHGEVQNSTLIMGVGIALTGVIVLSCIAVYGFYVHYLTQASSDREDARTYHEAVKLPRDRSPGSDAGQIDFSNLSPTFEAARLEKGDALLALRDGRSFKLPTEKEGVMKDVRIIPMEEAMNAVAAQYAQRKTASKDAESQP